MSKGRAKRYYLKFNVVNNSIILDVNSSLHNEDEILLSNHTITVRQGKLLRDAMKEHDKPYSTEVLFLFDKLFNVCPDCGIVLTKSSQKAAQKNRCVKCWNKFREERRDIWFKNRDKQRDYERQMRKLRLHLKTPQGRVDAVPMDIIESNIRIALARKGGTFKEMGEFIGVSPSVIYSLFRNKYIRVERLLQICEYLKVNLGTILAIPIGVKIPKIDGVPKHMVEGRVPYLHESIPRKL